MESPDEINLICQLKNDDPEAFRKIFNRYHVRIYAFALRLMNSDFEAEEIVQSVFFAFWDQRKRINIKTSVQSYLFGIARHKIYETIKQKMQEELITEYFINQNPDYSLITEEELGFNELCEQLDKLLVNLPPRRREIFMLNRLEGLSYAQIAEKLGITENTVDTQIRHALNYLRTGLSKKS